MSPTRPGPTVLDRQLSPGPSTGDCVELPRSGDAFELVLSSVLEVDIGACDKVLDGRGDDHLPGTGERRHPRSDVDCDAGNVVAAEFDLPSVEPGPHVDAE